ncbi:hypothetical protein K2O51_22915 [Cupriavidus pinatubonensis]|uniref:hypothetical protein n=1 Tax=Cupriavidus pinatubonensis TaxID=248026 RepID=UPI001C736D89|nr:hypothetical protein [Cupriavidus pinatubonensis]QYY30227.1 hypothetical protein K2O51_22915 [Cupriavidus pinatubonensis]
MATNDFLVFGGGAGANVITQVTYSGLAARTAGFSSGVAQSAQLNKVWRQSSIMSAVLAQFIADNTGLDALDDGTTATLLANLKTATTGRLINVQVFTSSGTYTPTSGTKSVIVEGVGGGGGSGGTAATSGVQSAVSQPGGSGTYARARFTSGFTSGLAVTIGAAGSAGAAGANNGGSGGTTSLGAIFSCPGGVLGAGGSVVGSAAATPAGGRASGATISGAAQTLASVPGQGGSVGCNVVPASSVTMGGTGGSNPLGTGGQGNAAGAGYGAGAGAQTAGVSTSAQAGFAGQQGVLIVYEYA